MEESQAGAQNHKQSWQTEPGSPEAPVLGSLASGSSIRLCSLNEGRQLVLCRWPCGEWVSESN